MRLCTLWCVEEFGQPLGAIGDSLGWVSFDGVLPNGTLHLRIVAPAHLPMDTTVTWQAADDAKPIMAVLRPRVGAPIEPSCPTGAARR